jgi:hypothetical protein
MAQKQKPKRKKERKKKNLFGTTVSITKNGIRQHSGFTFKPFSFLNGEIKIKSSKMKCSLRFSNRQK